MALSSQKFTGPFAKTINVGTNDPRHPTVRLTCSGQIRAPMRMSAHQINFGEVSTSSGAAVQFISMRPADAGVIRPLVMPPLPPGLSTEIREVVPGDTYEMQVTLDPLSFFGAVRTSLAVSSGAEGAPSEFLTVLATVDTPLVQLIPPSLVVPEVVSQDMFRTIRFFFRPPRGKSRPNILALEVSDERLTVAFHQEVRDQSMTMKVPAGFTWPSISPSVTVLTDDPTLPTFMIPIVRGEEQLPLNPVTGLPAGAPAGSFNSSGCGK